MHFVVVVADDADQMMTALPLRNNCAADRQMDYILLVVVTCYYTSREFCAYKLIRQLHDRQITKEYQSNKYFRD